MVKKVLDYVVETFGFDNFNEYVHSLFHRDATVVFLISSTLISSITLWIEKSLGIKPVLIGAIILLLIWELFSGLIKMKKSKEEFSSNRFGRFSLKAFFWISLFYIVYSFRSQFDGTNIIAFELFDWIHTAALVYMFLEYLISVDENMAKITNKENTFLQLVIKKVKSFLSAE